MDCDLNCTYMLLKLLIFFEQPLKRDPVAFALILFEVLES